jgi:hypothetical protein
MRKVGSEFVNDNPGDNLAHHHLREQWKLPVPTG